MISRRITFSALFILILVASLFAGLTSCSDVFLQKESADFALSFVAPGASSGRSADGAADWNVTAWLELEDGTTLQSQQTTAVAGEPVAIPFAPVAAGTKLQVRVELVDAAGSPSKYVGASDWIVVKAGENSVDVLLEAATTVTTWAELAKAVADTATSTIYVDAATMTAESGITFNGNKQIIPLQKLTITVALASVPDEVFPGLFFIQPDSNISLGNDDYTITLNDNNMNNCAGGLIWSEGTLSMTNVVAENFVNGNGLLYSTGTSILNNVSLSGSWQSGTTDIIIGSSDSGENTLEIGQNVAISEVGFVVEADAPCQPRIQLNANSSLKVDSPKIKINVTYFAAATQTTSPPDGLQIVSVGDYAGDPNGLFEVVGNDGAIYTLDSEGRLVAADDSTGQENPPSQEPGTTTPEGELGSQTNPVITWTDLQNLIENGTNPIYISGTMDASETIMVTDAAVELISVGNTTIIRNSLLSDELFWSEQSLTFTGSENASIIFAGNNVQATSPMISAAANLTMTHCTLQNNVNTSTSGGAIHITEGVLKLNHCFFESNKTMSSTGQGGALCVEGQTTTSHITSCTFRNNTSSFGGGAIVIDGDVSSETNYTHTLRSCTFTDNSTSGGNGGGIYMHKGYVTIDGIEMSGNTQGASNDSQDIYFLKTNDLILTGNVSIQSLYYNFSNGQFPKLKVVAPFESSSSVSIILSPDSTNADYPSSHQLFTLADGVSEFSWVSNFTITGADGSSYSLSDYGVISKL